MLNQIIKFSINNKLIIGLMVIGLVLWGAYQVTKLPIDAVPDITDNQVQVITVSPALGAPDVERLITFPIEQANSNIPGLKEIRSFSRFGLSLVTIVFDDEVDIYWARQQVSERLQEVQAQIPPGIGNPGLAPVTTGLGEIYQYVVKAKPGYESKYSLADLRTIQDWMVRRQLLGTKGVADVSSFGGMLKQYEVAINPSRLKAMNITVSDVFDALESNNENTGGSYIEKGPTVLYIRSEGLIASIADIENIAVKTGENGIPLRIRDVAEVREGAATRYGAMCYNDQGEVAGAVVMMLKGENSSAVIKNVKEKIAQIEKSLPPGIVIEPFLDRTKMVGKAVSTLERNLVEGALIVVIVLVFFLGNLRAGFIVASVIPLSMLFAIILMNAFGVSGNLMSLGAIDFGLIVDGAVIIVEAVLHRLTHSKHFSHTNVLTPAEMDNEVGSSTSKIMNAAVFGQIIILIVYLPILSLQGIEGKMFRPMAETIIFAVLGAFLLSLTYVPMMSALLISRKISHKPSLSDRIMGRIERWYQLMLDKALSVPKTIIASSVGLLVVAGIIMSGLGGEFIPELEEGDFAVDTRLLTGANLNTTVKYTQQAAKVLRESFPEVEKVVTKIGSGEIPTDPMPLEASDMMVILKDKSEWTSANSFDELAEKMGKKMESIPGLSAGFQFPVQMRFNELMTGARQDVVCKIFGEDLDTLAAYAQKMGDIITGIEGAKDLYVEKVTGMPQVLVNYNRAAMSRYGLTVKEVNNVLNTAFAGQSAGTVYEGEKRFDLVVRMDNDLRSDVKDVGDLLVNTPSGVQVPLREVAEIAVMEGPNQIQREDAKRRIIVGFNVRGRDVQTIVKELQGKVNEKLKFPAGYYPTYGGAFENLQAAKQRLSIAGPLALLLIFLLLYFAFRSMRQGLLIYTAIPLSAIGGIIALWARGMPFSISAGVGFIALFGIAVLNGIVLISEFNRLQDEGWTDRRKIAIMGTKIRLRSVLMTAIVPSFGFIPMAVSSGAGAEVQKPLATVVIFGLITASLLTLFVLPVLYVMFSKKSKPVVPPAAAALILLFMPAIADAQSAPQPLSLQQSIETALNNNLELKSTHLSTQYYDQQARTWFDPPKTSVTGTIGQINSIASDNSFGISQSISFPSVYRNQGRILDEHRLVAMDDEAITRLHLKQRVKESYYNILVMKEKKKLLVQADSIYTKFRENAAARFNAGESNVLERSMAEMQAAQITSQLQALEHDLAMELQQFNQLLGAAGAYEPKEEALKYESAADTLHADHPLLQKQQHLLNAGQYELKLQRSKLMPDLSVGITSMTIKGWQNVNGTDTYFDASKRFNAVNVSVEIPLLFFAPAAKVKSAKISCMKLENDYNLARQELSLHYQLALQEQQKNGSMLKHYESSLKEAASIMAAAAKQFQAGEINYIEWTVLMNQGIAVRAGYLDAVSNYNTSVFNLEYISGKN